jgi:molybdopterin biosynthesis enzyme
LYAPQDSSGSPIRELTRRRQNLKRVEVIEDDESEIIEAVRRMSERYDMVVTRSGLSSPLTSTSPEALN